MTAPRDMLAFEVRDGRGMGDVRKHVQHQLGRRQDHGLRTPVPAVAGTESLLEEDVLVVDAGLLVQGPEVPEDPHVNNAIVHPAQQYEVFPDDVAYDRQVKPVGVRMTSGQQSFTCGGCASTCGTLRALMSKSTRIEHVPKLIIWRSIENRCLNNLPCARCA